MPTGTTTRRKGYKSSETQESMKMVVKESIGTHSNSGWAILGRALHHHIVEPFLCAAFLFLLRPIYLAAVNLFPETDHGERLFAACATALIHTGMYAVMNGFFYYCDTHDLLQHYKIPRRPVQIPKWELIKDTLKQAAIGQILVVPTVYYLHSVFIYFGTPPVRAPLPPFYVCCFQFWLCLASNEVLFYFAHRLFHESKFLYRWAHKQHHTYTGSIGFAAEYAHWSEQILANQGPTVFGALFFGLHMNVWFIWLGARLFDTYEGHSGYAFRGTALAKLGILHPRNTLFHDYHHSANQGNYGSELLDWIFGTNVGWENYVDSLEQDWSVPKMKAKAKAPPKGK